MSLRILFVPFGSEGDINPLFWLADGLAERGHEPVFLLPEHYSRGAERRGFHWFPIGNADDFTQFVRNPDLWDKFKGPSTVVKALLDSFPRYQEAFEKAGSDFDLVVTSSFSLPASSLAEAAGIPRLTLHFQPVCLLSEFACPVFVPELAWLPRAPRWVKRWFFRLVDVTLWSKLKRPLNDFRTKRNLPPITHVYQEAINGANGVAALFPDWFASHQPDWPSNLRQFGFPIAPRPPSLPDDLEAFLQAGAPPIVWTHGSANFFVKKFHSAAIAATKKLGCRSVLVSLAPPEEPLPPDVFHCPHARFDALFPRSRAAVHHGGIGTTSKCIAAGIPQLIIPRSHDQPDNAHRIVQLGLGATMNYSRIHTSELSSILESLLYSPGIKTTCGKYQTILNAQDSRPALCDWAEQLAKPSCVAPVT